MQRVVRYSACFFRKFYRTCIVMIVLTLAAMPLKAQYYGVGEDPGSLRWYQIKTGNFEIIFPEDFRSEAQRLTNLFEAARPHIAKTIDSWPRRLPVIIHNHSVISNAYSIWAPRRMEFYTCTPQSTYCQDWLEQLVLHEYRHITQFTKIDHGLARGLYYLTGEQGTILLFGLFAPSWFTEGDAVTTETALSESGRGRTPNFDMQFRAQVLDHILYSWHKAAQGSYKDYVPNEYYLGYLMVANARKDFGPQLWERSLDRIGSCFHRITPFASSIKRITGVPIRKLYRRNFRELDSLWTKQIEGIRLTDYRVLSPSKKLYTNYQFPIYLNDSVILTEKSGLGNVREFVVLQKGRKERVLVTPGFYNPVHISSSKESVIFSKAPNKRFEELNLTANGNVMVWAENQYDPRWANRTWSILKRYDYKQRRIVKITNRTRYFAPDISPDSQKIVAVEVSPDNKFSLVILNASDGKLIRKFTTASNDFFITPSWSKDGSQIVTVFMNRQGKGLYLIEAGSLRYKKILPEIITELYRPVLAGSYVYYNGIYGGKDDIYALHLPSGRTFRVTESKYGAVGATVSPDGKKLAYANYTSMGFEVVETPLDSVSWTPLAEVRDHSVKIYDTLAKQEGWTLNEDSIHFREYEVKRYRKGAHLFNIHSWSPGYIDINGLAVTPGATILSQNALSTAVTMLGWEYNLNDKTNKYVASFTYSGFYPVISLSADYGQRKGYFVSENQPGYYKYHESNINLGFSLPLNLTRGKYFRSLIPAVGTGFTTTYLNEPDLASSRTKNLFSYQVSFYNLVKSSDRDMRSRWGQALEVLYEHTPFESGDNSLLGFTGYLLFPGLAPHHSLKLSGGYQELRNYNYLFSDLVLFPRGIGSELEKRQGKLSVDYKFPVLYPDLSIGPIFYFKRVKMNLFMDYMMAEDRFGNGHHFRSAGTELTTDVHIVHSIIPFDMGVRYVYLPAKAGSVWEFITSVSLDSF